MNSVVPQNYTQEEITRKFDTSLQVDSASKGDLACWVSLNRNSLGLPILPTNPTVMIDSDASSKDWGAILNSKSRTGGVWSTEKALHHINYLELLAAFLAIQAFGKTWERITILLRIDNVTAVTYINQKGGTTSNQLCQLSLSIWSWCTAKSLLLVAEHLPGHLNTMADQESQSIRDVAIGC